MISGKDCGVHIPNIMRGSASKRQDVSMNIYSFTDGFVCIWIGASERVERPEETGKDLKVLNRSYRRCACGIRVGELFLHAHTTLSDRHTHTHRQRPTYRPSNRYMYTYRYYWLGDSWFQWISR